MRLAVLHCMIAALVSSLPPTRAFFATRTFSVARGCLRGGHTLSRQQVTASGRQFQHDLVRPNIMSAEDIISNFIVTLYDDEKVLAINKPSNMCSVQGTFVTNLVSEKSRSDQWIDAVTLAFRQEVEAKGPYREVFKGLLEHRSGLPRKPSRFDSFIMRTLGVKDADTRKKIWQKVYDADRELHNASIEDIRFDLVSAFDCACRMVGHKIYVVHRLDMATSGTLIFAKDESSAAELCRQFRDREVSKIYLALVANRMDREAFQVDVPIRPDYALRPKQVIYFENGKESHTEGRVISTDPEVIRTYFPDVALEDWQGLTQFSLVELKPITGRTHQLRIHMAHLGHHILGDSLYSADPDDWQRYKRLYLHAKTLEFQNPVTREPIVLDCMPGRLFEVPGHCRSEERRRAAETDGGDEGA